MYVTDGVANGFSFKVVIDLYVSWSFPGKRIAFTFSVVKSN